MGKSEAGAPPARRGFLKALGLSAGVAAAPLAVPGQAEARESREEARKARYNPESPDVQAYYRTNRYER